MAFDHFRSQKQTEVRFQHLYFLRFSMSLPVYLFILIELQKINYSYINVNADVHDPYRKRYPRKLDYFYLLINLMRLIMPSLRC